MPFEAASVVAAERHGRRNSGRLSENAMHALIVQYHEPRAESNSRIAWGPISDLLGRLELCSARQSFLRSAGNFHRLGPQRDVGGNLCRELVRTVAERIDPARGQMLGDLGVLDG